MPSQDADADVEASVPLCPAPPESIWRALELLDLELLKQWVDYDEYCMHERDDDLRQPLCVAMELGFERAIKLLIKRGAPLLDIDGKVIMQPAVDARRETGVSLELVW